MAGWTEEKMIKLLGRVYAIERGIKAQNMKQTSLLSAKAAFFMK